MKKTGENNILLVVSCHYGIIPYLLINRSNSTGVFYLSRAKMLIYILSIKG